MSLKWYHLMACTFLPISFKNQLQNSFDKIYLSASRKFCIAYVIPVKI